VVAAAFHRRCGAWKGGKMRGASSGAGHWSEWAAAGPEAAMVAAETCSLVRALVAGCEPRQGAVLRIRHGLDGGDPRTLVATGHELARFRRLGADGPLSQERVRQLEWRGLVDVKRRLRFACDATYADLSSEANRARARRVLQARTRRAGIARSEASNGQA
jgi:hypothetical protein